MSLVFSRVMVPLVTDGWRGIGLCHAKMSEKKDSILKFTQESGRWHPGMSHSSEDNGTVRISCENSCLTEGIEGRT